jgi:energy-converting hydrogenase Eha subunit A
MIDLLAYSRPGLPLFVHVFGAMVLVGAVTASVVAQLWTVAPTDGDRLRRFSFRTLLLVAIPAWFVMAAGSEWIYSKEYGDTEPDLAWINIGFMTREGGGLLLLIATICAGIASRRSKSGLAKASGIVAAIALAAWIVAIWAMSAKPS